MVTNWICWTDHRYDSNKSAINDSSEKKISQGLEGKPFFIKKDSEESLAETMLLASALQPTDSQVDGQTWHDLDLYRVFDQLNYTQSSIGAEALYQKMRLIKFQPEASLQELEDFFDHHPDLRLKVQVVMNQLGKRTTIWLEVLWLIQENRIRRSIFLSIFS